jgi:subtilisin family serine protease
MIRGLRVALALGLAASLASAACAETEATVETPVAVEDTASVESTPSVERYLRPPDPGFPYQWNLENTGQRVRENEEQRGVYDADIDAVEAFAAGHDGRDVTIALIGTGFRWAGSPLEPVLWRNPREIPGNGLDDDGNGLVDDFHGYDFAERDSDPHSSGWHDLVVAEMAVAPHDRRTVAGIAPQARLMLIKIADDSGRILMSPLPQAILYALQQRARVIFMPWSAKGKQCGAPEFAHLSRFIQQASEHALIIGGRPGEWPACLPGVVSVRASRPDDRPEGLPASDVDFAAPGADGRSKVYPSNAIGVAAGAAALVFAQDPSRTPAEVRKLLVRTADRVHPELRPYRGGRNVFFGAGRINLARALGTDFDGDGILDADDADADGDDIPDVQDACTLDPDPECTEPARQGQKEQKSDGS